MYNCYGGYEVVVMQEGFCCTHLAFRLALQTSQANWVSVSETFPQQKDFGNCQGGEERRATCSHHGGSTRAVAINFHLGPGSHGDGKTTAQHVPPQRNLPIPSLGGRLARLAAHGEPTLAGRCRTHRGAVVSP